MQKQREQLILNYLQSNAQSSSSEIHQKIDSDPLCIEDYSLPIAHCPLPIDN